MNLHGLIVCLCVCSNWVSYVMAKVVDLTEELHCHLWYDIKNFNNSLRNDANVMEFDVKLWCHWLLTLGWFTSVLIFCKQNEFTWTLLLMVLYCHFEKRSLLVAFFNVPILFCTLLLLVHAAFIFYSRY